MSKWQPIETFELPAFDAEHWYRGGKRCLLSTDGSNIFIGHYSYTQRGKGRWMDDSGYVSQPQFWRHLPEPPK